jgi:hypothetical protein
MQQTVWVMEPLAVDSVQTPYLNLEGKNDINHTYNREQKINVTKTKQKTHKPRTGKVLPAFSALLLPDSKI